MTTWRAAAAPIIRHVIATTGREDMRVLKQKLRDAFPWGDYASNYHPVRIWRDEINRQLGLKPPLQRGGRRSESVPEEQGQLF